MANSRLTRLIRPAQARYADQMRKLLPGLILIAALATIVAVYEPDNKLPERYGDVARRKCAREAGRSDADQRDCYDRKLTIKAFQMQSARDARR